MRRFLAATIGRVLGVVLGLVYFAWLVGRNLRRRLAPYAAIIQGVNGSLYGVPFYPLEHAHGLGRHIQGVTFGAIIFFRGAMTEDVLRHELRHVLQYYHYRRFAFWRFLAEYGRQVFLYGYRNAPIEVKAYREPVDLTNVVHDPGLN